MAYINIQNVSKNIHKASILRNINLSLEKGKIYGFVGKNGSGKTMLFKAILGLIKIDTGTIAIDNKKIINGNAFPVPVGIMIENIGLWSYLSAYDNLKALDLLSGKPDKNKIINAIETVGLDPYSKKKFSSFSLGMKQRLVLAQAIMDHPELLVLDEPTNALDAEGIQLFKRIIKKEVEKGTTVLISSHSMEDFNGFCDEVFHLSNGEVIK